MALVTLSPNAQTLIWIVAGFFALSGFFRGWAREARLFLWLLVGLAIVFLGGPALISRLNDFYRAFRILLQSGFNIRAAFAGAAEKFAAIPPLIPPQWEKVALLIIFLLIAWWGNRVTRPTRSPGDSLIAALRSDLPRNASFFDQLLAIPGAILRRVPAAILGGVNGFIIALTVASLLARIDSIPVQTAVITLPVGQALDLVRNNLATVLIILIVAGLLRLAQTATAGARSR